MAGSALCRYYSPVSDSYRFISSFLHVWSSTGSFFCCSQSKAILSYTMTYQVVHTATAVLFWEMTKKHPVACSITCSNGACLIKIKKTPCITNMLAQAATGLTCNCKARIFCLVFNTQLRTAVLRLIVRSWLDRSNFRHQVSPRVSPRESAQRWKVELWARNVR
jgi:hypothetical protein